MSTYCADAALAQLKDFQRATVDHVTGRFYDDAPAARRFLVADETGLGKSLVARGVIARTIERLQHDDTVKRIDIIYICSNAAIAAQNLQRLDVLSAGKRDRGMRNGTHHATRLTLLAKAAASLGGDADPQVGKRVNLVSFTPGTSFELGSSAGRAEERALLHHILCEEMGWDRGRARTAASVVLRGSSSTKGFKRATDALRNELDGQDIDQSITRPFIRQVRRTRLLNEFRTEVEHLGRRRSSTVGEAKRHKQLVGKLRAALARAGVDALEPDLVILDEFQRFRHLLEVGDSEFGPAAELARSVFNYGAAKVLLLSATPYKPFTYAEEAAVGEDHLADLKMTLRFLANASNGNASADAVVDQITADLALFRRSAIDGVSTDEVRGRLERSLTRLMCRTERPRLGDDGMLAEHCLPMERVDDDDLVDYAGLRRLAADLDGAPFNIEYWKSSPYFANFGDNYQFGGALRARLKDATKRRRLRPRLDAVRSLDADRVSHAAALDPANARMRHLVDSTVGKRWWQLLWVPPSMPYEALGGPFSDVGPMTKRLIFSSWTAAPTAIASLVSHEAARRMLPAGAPESSGPTRLGWRVDGGRPGAMTTLALFWPAPGLARSGDPLDRDRTAAASSSAGRSTGAEPWYWQELFRTPGAIPDGLEPPAAAAKMEGLDDLMADEDADPSGSLEAHVRLAFHLAGRVPERQPEPTMLRSLSQAPRARRPDDLDGVIARLARYGPGNIAYRCLRRLRRTGDAVTELGLWLAAATISGGLRSLFNRPDTALLLDQLRPNTVYWRGVLDYCAWGGLEAVLDEYLHHLAAVDRAEGLDDTRLREISRKARAAMSLRPARYEAFDPRHPSRRIPFMSRFALRYGAKRVGADDEERLPIVQGAFNSPFWPFVLATTSVGQEGIDFHWWCHAAVHWNTPANPVDFEQREGRVNRYGGHAIRRNLAAKYRDRVLAEALSAHAANDDGRAPGEHPWDTAYRLAEADASGRYGELDPYWILDGPTKIERHVLLYPLSRDIARYQQLKQDLALYRLAFGQPRQEDFMEMLRKRGVHLNPQEIAALRLDLRPPTATGSRWSMTQGG